MSSVLASLALLRLLVRNSMAEVGEPEVPARAASFFITKKVAELRSRDDYFCLLFKLIDTGMHV